MKTNPSEATKSSEREENSRNVRMSLHVLQPAATDKENLVGPGRSAHIVPEKSKNTAESEKKTNETLIKNVFKKKKTNKISSGETSKKTVSASDLTNEEPSEAYWKQLAEKRRVALEEALVENESLNQRIEILEQENALAQEMLNEARSLIEVLNEIIDGNGNDNSQDDADNNESGSQD